MEEQKKEQELLCYTCTNPIGEHIFWSGGERICELCWWNANEDSYYPPED